MGKRTRVQRADGSYMYLTRDKKGRFKNWTNIGKSINADKRTKAKKVKPGYGHQGDLKGKRTRKRKSKGGSALMKVIRDPPI